MTVRLDTARRRIVLDDAALAVACLLAVEPDHDALTRPGAREPHTALEAAGALREGRPLGWLAPLLEIVARPDSRARVELHADGQLVVTAAAWGRGERCVLGLLAEGGTELSALEPLHLPWVIAREVALRNYPQPVPGGPLALGVEQIALAQRALEAGDEEKAASALGEHAAALPLLRDRNSSWRVTVTSGSEEGETSTRSVAALDGGPHGLFLTEAVDLDDGSPGVRLHPSDTDSAVEALLALFEPESAPAVAP